MVSVSLQKAASNKMLPVPPGQVGAALLYLELLFSKAGVNRCAFLTTHNSRAEFISVSVFRVGVQFQGQS